MTLTERALAGGLTEDDCRRIADCLFERLEERGAVSVLKASGPVETLVDAAELARELRVSRDFVYRNKRRLGGHPLSEGPKARWRFDVEKARAALRNDAEPEESVNVLTKSPARTPRRWKPSSVPLLPIK